MPGQQLVQFPDGKLQVLTTTQVSSTPAAAPKPTPTNTPVKPQVTKPAVTASTPVGKLTQLKPINSPAPQVVQSQTSIAPKAQVIKQQGAQVLQKIAQAGVAISTSQVPQVVVGANQMISTQGGQQVCTVCSGPNRNVVVEVLLYLL